MNTEQERADFEAWAKERGMTLHKASPCDGSSPYYLDTASIAAWEAWQARAANGDALDAARYRWLRSPDNPHGPSLVAFCKPDELDAAIDAAMQRTSDGGAA